MFSTGLELIYQLTRRNQYKLRVDLEDFDGSTAYAEYESFLVDSEADGYKLHVSGFVNGGAGRTIHKCFQVFTCVTLMMNLLKLDCLIKEEENALNSV